MHVIDPAALRGRLNHLPERMLDSVRRDLDQ